MSADDLVTRKPPAAEAAAPDDPKPEDKDKPMPMITKLVGLGAVIAGAVWFFKFRGKGKPPSDPGIAI